MPLSLLQILIKEDITNLIFTSDFHANRLEI